MELSKHSGHLNNREKHLPKYSTMAPVPPLTVSMSATLRITSLHAVHPDSLPVSLTPITCKQQYSNYAHKPNVGAVQKTGERATFEHRKEDGI